MATTEDILGQYPFAYIYASTTSTAQNIGDASMTSVLFNAEQEKIDITHSTSSNQDQFTIVQAGYYVIDASLALGESTAGNVRSIQLTLNGAEYSIEDKPPLDPPFADNAQHLQHHSTGKFAVNDILRIQVYQDSGSGKDLVVDANKTYVKIMRIR
jgi:hypothetical protein